VLIGIKGRPTKREAIAEEAQRMIYFNQIALPRPGNPRSLFERLVMLALDEDRTGFTVATEHLLYLASQVLDQPDSLRAQAILANPGRNGSSSEAQTKSW